MHLFNMIFSDMFLQWRMKGSQNCQLLELGPNLIILLSHHRTGYLLLGEFGVRGDDSSPSNLLFHA